MTAPPTTAADAAWHAAVCRSKRRFLSNKQAKSWAKGARGRFGSQQIVYKCDVCDGWHLCTKQKQLKHRRRKAEK